ncbi:MAG: hypothetical protein M3314_13295 [Actinomycetota bacterium]|nr:hypothetical protein [Actinomycetota bacterium]
MVGRRSDLLELPQKARPPALERLDLGLDARPALLERRQHPLRALSGPDQDLLGRCLRTLKETFCVVLGDEEKLFRLRFGSFSEFRRFLQSGLLYFSRSFFGSSHRPLGCFLRGPERDSRVLGDVGDPALIGLALDGRHRPGPSLELRDLVGKPLGVGLGYRQLLLEFGHSGAQCPSLGPQGGGLAVHVLEELANLRRPSVGGRGCATRAAATFHPGFKPSRRADFSQPDHDDASCERV